MIKEEFNEILEEIRSGAELEVAFPGKFTAFEKATITMNIMNQILMGEISDALVSDIGVSIADQLLRLTEAVEKI